MLVQKPREIAARVLQRHADGGVFVENLLDAEFARQKLSDPDRRLARELVFGVVRWQAPLDWLIDRKTDARPQKPALRTLLRLGLYQMFMLDRIPDHAAVNETVDIAKRIGFHSQAGFINAILRGYAREKEQTRELLKQLKVTDPALGHSHPQWLWERWRRRWGADQASELLRWNNTPPKTYARLNTLRAKPEALIEKWRMEEKVDYDFFQRDWTGENLVFELKSHPPLDELPSFRQGWFYVQDPSTLLAVRELDPEPGDDVLDCCAAPGGKTTFIAQLMENRGAILAQDVQEDRLALIRENCDRLGVTCAETILGSVRPESIIHVPKYDRILVDAPCSNTGVLRRRVDLRWRIRSEEIERLRGDQLAILRQAAPQLVSGGTLVYSTCSLEPEENQQVVKAFLDEHPEFQLDKERELIPFKDGVDGAYVATLYKE